MKNKSEMSKHEPKEKKRVTEPAQSEHKEHNGFMEAGKDQEPVPYDQQATTGVEDETGEDKAEQKQNGNLAGQVAELTDKYLRLYSEFDNYRKRTLKEKIELSKSASAELITKLLPVLDDFERAIKAFDANPESPPGIKEGILLIFNKFITILNQEGLEQMKTIGEEFNTDFHEAITNIPALNPEQRNKILDEVEKGYLLNGKVMRYAKVVVGN